MRDVTFVQNNDFTTVKRAAKGAIEKSLSFLFETHFENVKGLARFVRYRGGGGLGP